MSTRREVSKEEIREHVRKVSEEEIWDYVARLVERSPEIIAPLMEKMDLEVVPAEKAKYEREAYDKAVAVLEAREKARQKAIAAQADDSICPCGHKKSDHEFIEGRDDWWHHCNVPGCDCMDYGEEPDEEE